MSSEKNAYAEMPVTQKVYKLETPQLSLYSGSTRTYST